MTWLWVGAGGFIGSVLRYGISALVQKSTGHAINAWGTFTVNAAGCLLIGVLAGLMDGRAAHHPARLFFITGVLGGFTTFSAFAMESVALLRSGQTWQALAYAGGSTLTGLALAFLGYRLATLS